MTVNSVYYADTSETADIMIYPTFELDAAKHPLFSVTTYAIVSAFTRCFGLARDNAVLAAISFLGAVNVLLSYFIFGFFGRDGRTALAFAALFGVFFSNLVLSSIPETYVLSNMMILVYVFFARRFADDPGFLNNFMLAAVTGLASLCNPPLLLLFIATCYTAIAKNGLMKALRPLAFNALVAVWIFLGANLLIHPNYFFICDLIIQQNASFGNFLRFYNFVNVIFSFLLFAVISPLGVMKDVIGAGDVRSYFTSPLRLALLLPYICFLAVSLKKAFKSGGPLLAGLLFWVPAMILFYVYFNPGESVLYSSQTLLPLLLAMSAVFEGMAWRYKYPAVACFAVMLFASNNISLVTMFNKS